MNRGQCGATAFSVPWYIAGLSWSRAPRSQAAPEHWLEQPAKYSLYRVFEFQTQSHVWIIDEEGR
jgi:hypothetical protein